jgi:RNA polymerase sigma-70 factor (ECF subfamily)
MASETAVLTRLIPWIARATEGDWNALFADQLPRVYNFFRYRLGDGPDAEDLTSITFEKAWRARHRYRRDLAGFTTWLLTIARHAAIDHHRRARHHLPLDSARHVAGGPTPEDLAGRASDVARLEDLLGRLAERERELVAFKYGAGLTNREIARLTGLSESNVGTILHRTIEGLRAGWEGKEKHDG